MTSSAIPIAAEDFVPLPSLHLTYRGILLSRTRLLKAIRRGDLKSRLFREPGNVTGRRLILRSSLDAYILASLHDVPVPTAKRSAA